MPDLFDPVLAVEIDQVNGKLHEERVHRLAGNNPKAFPLCQSLASQQALVSLLAGIGRLDTFIREPMGECGAGLESAWLMWMLNILLQN